MFCYIDLLLGELFTSNSLILACLYFHNLLIERLGRHVVSNSDISLEQAIVESFTQRGLKLATAESCTGGGIASSITSIPGSSSIFDCA